MRRVKKLILLFSLVILFGISIDVLALETSWPTSPLGTNLTDETTLPEMVKYFYEWGIFIGGIITFIALIAAGIEYLTAAGSPARLADARNRVISALIGLILLLGSFLILNTINPALTILSVPKVELPSAIFVPVILYSGANYSGASTTLGVGECLDLTTTELNGTVGSAKINGAYSLNLYNATDTNCSGVPKRSLQTDQPNITDTYGSANVESSVSVIVKECEKVTLYTQPNYGGKSLEIIKGEGCKNISGSPLKGEVASAKFEGKCTLYMYSDESCSIGPLFLLDSNIPDIGAKYGTTFFDSVEIYP